MCKPPRVHDIELFWQQHPKQLSDRCKFWLAEIKAGWKPNKRIRALGYYSSARWFGVYIWEYLNVINPILYGTSEYRGKEIAYARNLIAIYEFAAN